MINDILQGKIENSYKVLKLAAEMSATYYEKPLILTYSGGKDSDVLAQLARECLKPSEFEVFNSHTTVDAPETVYYIRERFKEWEQEGIKCTIHYPHYKDGRPMSMWSLIVDQMIPPTRIQRYCCKNLKEVSTPNRFVATGVRAAESINRRGRDAFSFRGNRKDERHFYSLEHADEVFHESLERTEGGVKNESPWDCLLIAKAKITEEEYKDLISKLDGHDKALRTPWIPVSERLPEQPYGCLVTIEDEEPMTGQWFENILPYFVGWDGERWNDADGEQCPFEVIAWMPLPEEPYKAESEDKA